MPQREAEVPRALQSNGAAISELEMRVEQLISRLQPVMRQDGASPPELDSATKSTTELVQVLEGQRNRLDRMITGISRALDLLEI